MSTATLPARVNQETGISAETMEKVVVGGDLSRLSPAERLQWYTARCEAAGLDPRTQPFSYITLQGKLTLYATKTATDQLIASRKLTVEIVDRKHMTDLGIFEVQCRVKFPDGHHVEDFAAISVAGLKGDVLCNALMKAVSKAKRRTVLSACGLGMLDETEAETIPGASRVDAQPVARTPHPNNSGHKTGKFASDEQVEAYRKDAMAFCTAKNAEWADEWSDERGELREGISDLLHPRQLTRHCIKWGIQTGRLADVGLTLDPNTGQLVEKCSVEQEKKFVAIIHAREPEALHGEWEVYARQQAALARQAWREKHAATEGASDDSREG